MVHSDCFFKHIPWEIERKQMHNMFLLRNSYKVAILAYFESGGLEKPARWPLSLIIIAGIEPEDCLNIAYQFWECDQSFCLDAPLSLVSMVLRTIEATIAPHYNMEVGVHVEPMAPQPQKNTIE